MAEDRKNLYYGSPRPVRTIEGAGGTVFATPYHGCAILMAIKRARGVGFSEIVDDNGTYKLHIKEGHPLQRNIFIYQVSPEGFEPTSNPLIMSKRGNATPIGKVEKLAIEHWKHYFVNV